MAVGGAGVGGRGGGVGGGGRVGGGGVGGARGRGPEKHAPLGPSEVRKMLVTVRAARMFAFCASMPFRRVFVSWSRMTARAEKQSGLGRAVKGGAAIGGNARAGRRSNNTH